MTTCVGFAKIRGRRDVYPEGMTTSESGIYGADPIVLLRSLSLGSRVVVRIRLAVSPDAVSPDAVSPDGVSPDARAPRLTDALGYLLSLDESECVIETKRGAVLLRLADVVAAKEVPPPPAPRTGRRADNV
jgi:hypothetical protein